MNSKKNIFRKAGAWITSHKAISAAIISAVVLLAAGAIILFGINSTVHDPVAITAEITPTVSDSNGVYTDSAFLIDGEAFKDKEQLLSQLTTSVDIPFSVAKTVEGNYLLTFKSSLAPASMCSFMIDDGAGNDRSYAFQTKADFAVRSVFPKDSATVPLDTGVEISFTNDNFTDFEKYIKISPETDYTMEKVSNRLVIIPTENWRHDTYYTVTVKKGLSNSSGEALDEDFTSVFYAAESERPSDEIRRSGSLDETFLTTDVPVIELETSDYGWADDHIDYKNLKFALSVHQIPSADAYAEMLKAKEELDSHVFSYYGQYVEYEAISTEGMQEVLKGEFGLIPYASDSYAKAYIVFPQELPEGYYVATATCSANGKTFTIQKLIQINDTVVYLRSGHGEVFAWINDAKTASASVNATVSIDGGNSVKTNDKGIATLPFKGDAGAGIVRIETNGSSPFIASMQLASLEELHPSESYYSYLYTDRESYLPTDTVRVFGTLSPRYGAKLPENVTVSIGYVTYDYDYNTESDKIHVSKENSFYEVQADLNKHGIFTAEIPINKLQHGYYDISVSIDGEVVCMKGLEVEEYVKPAFTVEFDKLKDYYGIGDTVKFGMKAEYYGGIPAAGEEFTVNGDYCVTDESGRISVNYTASPSYYTDSWHPVYNHIGVEDALTLDKVNYFGTNYYCIPKDVMLTADIKNNGGGSVSLSINTNLIDVAKANSTEQRDYDTYDYLKGAAYDTTVRVYVESITSPPPTEYTYYDYVAKKTVTTLVYSYEDTTQFVSDTEYQTVNGEVKADLELPELENGYYKFTLSCHDTQGRYLSEVIFSRDDLYGDSFNSSNLKYYTVSDDGEPNYGGMYGTKYIKSKKIGEKFSLKLVDEMGNVIEDGRLMLGIVNSEICENRLYEALDIELTFKKEYVPNIHLVGAYFDGKRIHEITKSFVDYDYSEKELDISITTDKENYLPGEEMKVTVSLKDKEGKPQEGSVNISVVDEAQFAVAPQYANILYALYGRQVGSGCIDSFTSYTQHSFNGGFNHGGEGGGGEGDGSPRQNFLDTAAFEVVRTDKNGNAEIKITLPDNVTDWRITVSAVSDKLYGGNKTKNISAALDFVIDPVIGKVFQTGDDVSFGVHAYGAATVKAVSVGYTAVLKKPDGSEQRLEQSAVGRDFTYFNFGKLPKGEYSITVKGSSELGSDAVEESFTVVDSANELPIVSRFDLAEGIDINALRSPVTLSFSNASAKYVSSVLYELYYSSGARVDQQIASAVAGKILASTSLEDGKNYYSYPETELGGWQTSSGAVAIYPYAQEDAFITAFAAWADSESIDKDALKRYFNTVNDVEKYVGLAAIGEPVLLDIRALLAETDAADIYTRMLLTAALTAIGDDSGAEDEFNATFRGIIAEEGYSAWIESGDADMNDKLTAVALTVASRIDRELAVKFMRYFEDRQVKDYYGLQKVIYARNMLRGAYAGATLEYVSEGEVKKVALNGVQTKTFHMTADEIKTASFKAAEGEISVNACFVGSADSLSAEGSELYLEKTLASYDGTEINVGDKVEVTIYVPQGTDGKNLSISDYIPSGFRFSEFDYNRSENAWLCSQQGQKVNISVNTEYESAYAVFYIRAVTQGTFVQNSAFLLNSEGKWGMTPEVTVRVN